MRQSTHAFILFQGVHDWTEYLAQRPWLLYVEFQGLSTTLPWIIIIVIIR
jgi:hypothetical protein